MAGPSPFPDIDAAWDEAVQAIRQQGVSLSDLPIFLIVGQPQGGLDALFESACGTPPMPPLIAVAPASEAPVRLFASEKAVFVTCAGASLLGRQAVFLASLPSSGDLPPPDSLPPAAAFATIQASDRNEDVQRILNLALTEGRELTAEEREQIRALEKETQMVRSQRPRTSLLQDAAEVEFQTARLQHLCRKLLQARWPECPINGLLLLLPIRATDTDEDALETGLICQRDFAVVQETLQLRFPVLAAICDLETIEGARTFLQRFPADQRRQRLGQSHPWVPALSPEQLPQAIDAEVEWICQGVVHNWVYKLLALESGGKRGGDTTSENGRLFRFLARLRERQFRLARMLTSLICMPGVGVERPLFGGIYLAATGQKEDEQAFVAGVLHKLIESQDYVFWTSTALAEDTSCRRWTILGYILVVLLCVGVGWLLYSSR